MGESLHEFVLERAEQNFFSKKWSKWVAPTGPLWPPPGNIIWSWGPVGATKLGSKWAKVCMSLS